MSADLTWRLRRAVGGDAAALSLVASATFLEAFAGVLDGPDIVAHCATKSNAEVFAGWITDSASAVTLAEAEHGEAPLAYSVLTAPDLPVDITATDIELKRIYVLTALHGTGLAKALFERAVRDAQALGRSRMLLGVFGGNARAQRFYEKQGFARIGERRFLVGATLHDDFVYARDIAPH